MGWGINQYALVRIPIKKPCTGYYLRWYYNGWHYFFFQPGRYTIITDGEKYRTIGTRQISMGSGQQSRQIIAGIRTIMNTREVYLLTVAGWMNIRIEPSTVNIFTNQIAGEEIEFVAIIGSKEISYATGYTPVPGDGSVPEIPVVIPDVAYCEVTIGTQIWMCKNYDSNYPGSKVYDDNEYYRAIYGGLYSYAQINNPGFAPDGWHVPTVEEMQILLDYVGGLGVAGGELKEVGFIHWDAPNTGANDTYGFSWLGAGNYFLGAYNNQGIVSHLWAISSDPAYNPTYYTRYDSAAITPFFLGVPLPGYEPYYPVRLIKDTPAYPLVDKDGNEYETCIINGQEWITQNLKTTTYGDGTPIPNLTVNANWAADANGAYCYFNNNIANKALYGTLYNFWAYLNASELSYLERGGVREAGWRLPTLAEITALGVFLGADSGQDLREVGYTKWDLNAPPYPGLDTYGFNSVPAQYRNLDGTWSVLPYGQTSIWWVNEITAPGPGGVVKDWYCAYNAAAINTSDSPPELGLPIRLVRDI